MWLHAGWSKMSQLSRNWSISATNESELQVERAEAVSEVEDEVVAEVATQRAATARAKAEALAVAGNEEPVPRRP